jgi:acyl transferase domain-containing protein
MSPALFMLEFALTELWKSWGIKPKALIGHAVGEFVAACVAGIFSLEDALMLVAQLSRLARDLPAGPLLSVALSADEAQRRLNQNLALAAIYRPDLCLVTGTPDAVTALQGALAAEGVSCACVQTAHAFYPMLPDAVITAFSQTVDRVKRSAPQIPLIASATGTWITDAQALDAAYWLTPVRSACLFSAGLREVLRGRQRVLLEAGPGGMLSACARQLVSETPGTTVISSLPCADERHAEHAAVLTAAGRLWLCGAPLDGAAFYSRERRRRIPLPTYPFERERFWIAPTARSAGAAADAAPADDTIAGKKKQPYARERGVPARQPGTPAPRTETERALMDMCRFALQVPGIGTHDNLFPDGRNPSAAAEIVRQVQNRFNLRIDEQLVLDHPTVAGLAGCLDQKLNAQSSFHHARSRAQLKREALSTRTQKLKGDDHEQ